MTAGFPEIPTMPGETFDTPEAALCCSNAGFEALSEEYHRLIREGRYWRLSSPMENEEYTAWEFSSEDGSEALLNLVKTGTHCNAPVEYVRLSGLKPDGWYRITETESTRYGHPPRSAGNAILTDEQKLYPGSVLMSAACCSE